MKTLCRDLLDWYGYTDWTVEDTRGDYAGKARYGDKVVEISPLAGEDTVIHEVAHVRAGQFADSHGSHWEKLCHQMGGTGNIKTPRPRVDTGATVR